MSTERCTCSSHCIQVEGCGCGYAAARQVNVRVSGFVDLRIKSRVDLALNDAERTFLVECLIVAGETFDKTLKESRRNHDVQADASNKH